MVNSLGTYATRSRPIPRSAGSGDTVSESLLAARTAHAQQTRRDLLAGHVSDTALAAARDTIAETGHPLDPGVRTDLETRLHHNFADVQVHSDARAGHSALALGAQAYAVGRHVVFAPGHYQPTRSQGRELIAHELGHVAQHDRTAAPGSLRVAAADHVNSNTPAAAPGVIHRSLLGGILGGIGGAAVGAVGGALLGSLLGPIGTVVGGIIGGIVGGIAGVVAGDVATTDVRPLSSDERTEAYKVFGNNLDYDKVRLGESPIMGSGANARTPFNTIYFPPDAHSSPNFIPWLIHELTHVWQTQHGVSVVTKLWWALHSITGNPYDYGGEAGLIAAAGQGKHFRDFNTEQQGDICRSYYIALEAHQDTSAYEPFINEVKAREAPSRAGDFPRTSANIG